MLNPNELRLVLRSSLVMIALVSCTVDAQAQDSRQLSLGAAGGIATPWHGDFDFTARSWQADVRWNTSRHLSSTVFFEEWRHEDEEVLANQEIFGPDSPLGRADRIVTRTVHRTRTIGWSLLARGDLQRVTLSGGGGLSYLSYARDFMQTMTGCVPTALCSDASVHFDSSAFAVQMQAGVDVDVAPHLAAMGQFRLVVPVDDPGGGHHAIVAGVRVGF